MLWAALMGGESKSLHFSIKAAIHFWYIITASAPGKKQKTKTADFSPPSLAP
jgi:hypothetical protein